MGIALAFFREEKVPFWDVDTLLEGAAPLFTRIAEPELLRDAGGFPPGGRRLRAGLTPASAILSATVNEVFEARERNAAGTPRIEVTLCGTRMDRRNRPRGQVLGRDRRVTGISLALEATGVLLEAPRVSLERARGR